MRHFNKKQTIIIKLILIKLLKNSSFWETRQSSTRLSLVTFKCLMSSIATKNSLTPTKTVPSPSVKFTSILLTKRLRSFTSSSKSRSKTSKSKRRGSMNVSRPNSVKSKTKSEKLTSSCTILTKLTMSMKPLKTEWDLKNGSWSSTSRFRQLKPSETQRTSNLQKLENVQWKQVLNDSCNNQYFLS